MTKKNKVGRPVIFTPERLAELNKLINEYTEQTTIPILAECAYLNKVSREEMYRHPELNHSIKQLILKKEAALEKHGLTQNNTMAIFSLKQLGWKDTMETTRVEKITVKLPESFGD